MPKRGTPLLQQADRERPWGWNDVGVISGRYYPNGLWPEAVATTTTQFDQTFYRFYVAHTTFLVSGLGIEITTLQDPSLMRLGLYGPDKANNNLPGNLIEDCGTVDCSTTGGKDAAFAANRLFNAGEIYWLAYQSNDTAIGTRGMDDNWLGRPLTSAGGSALMRSSGVAYADGFPDPASPSANPVGKRTPLILVKAV